MWCSRCACLVQNMRRHERTLKHQGRVDRKPRPFPTMACALEQVLTGIGFTYKDLWDLLGHEVTADVPARWGRGVRVPSLRMALKVAQVLKMPVERLWFLPD